MYYADYLVSHFASRPFIRSFEYALDSLKNLKLSVTSQIDRLQKNKKQLLGRNEEMISTLQTYTIVFYL